MVGSSSGLPSASIFCTAWSAFSGVDVSYSGLLQPASSAAAATDPRMMRVHRIAMANLTSWTLAAMRPNRRITP